MSWQDELDKLDADLASGRINAGQHRKRADDLLAEASGPSPGASPAAGRGAGQERSDQQQAAQEPAAPPAEPENAPPGADAQQPPDGARRVPEQAPEPRRERPDDLVRDPQRLRPAPWQRPGVTAEPPPGQHPAPAREPTPEPTFPPVPDRRPGAAAQQPSPQNQSLQPQPVQQQPASPQPQQEPPRAAAPPVDIERITDKPRRGPRLPPRPWLIGAAAVLVLLLVAAGVWALVPGGQQDTGTRPQAAAPQDNRPPPPGVDAPEPAGPAVVPENLDATLPALPGKPLRAKHTQPVPSLVDDGYYSDAIARQITEAGTKSMLLHESVRAGKEIYLLAVLPAGDQRRCQATAATINDFQRRIGLAEDPTAALGANAVTLHRAGGGGLYYRSAYCSGTMTVISAAATADMGRDAGLRDGFTETGRAVTRTLPPN